MKNNPLARPTISESISVVGKSLVVHEWSGSGPDYMHVHYEDDEAWYVLEGTLTFRFAEGTVEARKGMSVFVPAGVAHTYSSNSARYLMILTPRLNELISELHSTPYDQHGLVMKKYKSKIVK